MNRVVITGIGIYSCIGKNVQDVKASLYAGKSGIQLDPQRTEIGFRSALTGMVDRPNLKTILTRRQRLVLAEEAEYAYVATREALAHAGMDEAFLDSNDVGVIYGNDSSSRAVIESYDAVRAKKDTTLLGSGSIFQSMNSTVTMNLATIFRLKGINFTVSAACASGSHAVGLGYTFIRNGLQDRVICGGAQEINPQAMASFDGLSVFSTRQDDPKAASRPFDRDRDGLVPSGGAASLILENYDMAKKRGASILGEIIGYGFSSNGAHISQPSVDGPAQSLRMALENAEIAAAEIDYINAHATSTPIGDKSEAEAINHVFGSHKPFVSSTKSMTGHECWMAGASEIVYSLIMLQNAFIAPNINFTNPDESSAKLKIAHQRIDKEFNIFLSNSFGFGGTNSSLIIKKVDTP